MGIVHSENLYALFHAYKLNKKAECIHTHESIKLIGVFRSRKKISSIIEIFRKLKGFRDHPDSFFIQKYTIDETNDCEINRLIENKRNKKYSNVL